MPVKLVADLEDYKVISLIVKRWARLPGKRRDLLDLELDITAAHLNGNPLRLAELLNAPEADFIHDISGIRQNIHRGTGRLLNLFSPRYSK